MKIEFKYMSEQKLEELVESYNCFVIMTENFPDKKRMTVSGNKHDMQELHKALERLKL